jgi:hypothetical protein
MQLTQYQLGELEVGVRDEVATHLETCARCRGIIGELEVDRRQFASSPVPIQLATRRRRRWMWPAAAGLVAAACLLLVVTRTVDPGGSRPKGRGANVTVYVEHIGVVRALAGGDVVAPGDRLRLVMRATETHHVALLSIDGAHHASVYLPLASQSTIPVPAGDQVSVPGAVALDEILGTERLFVLVCVEPTPLAAIVAGLPQPVLPDGCSLDPLVVTKQASR